MWLTLCATELCCAVYSDQDEYLKQNAYWKKNIIDRQCLGKKPKSSGNFASDRIKRCSVLSVANALLGTTLQSSWT